MVKLISFELEHRRQGLSVSFIPSKTWPILLIILQLFLINNPLVFADNSNSRQDEHCHYCQIITQNFISGLDKTQRENYGGGNTRWEESRLGSYAGSETRFLHIMEKLCDDVTDTTKSSVASITKSSKTICHRFVEEQEDNFEHWWFKVFAPSLKVEQISLTQTLDQLFNHLCVTTLSVCCPLNKYGPKCDICNGLNENNKVCSDHGKCLGNATRSGTGDCQCDHGYKGKLCDECSTGFYSEQQADRKDCVSCHVSCASAEGCSGPGPSGCQSCATGYTRLTPPDDSINNDDSPASPCVDVNECAQEVNPCASQMNKYCENTAGSYECKSCHSSCSPEQGCHGGGAGACKACSQPGYEWNPDTKQCQDVNECAIHEDVCSVKGQICRNTIGSFACECPPGEEENHDEGSCVKKKVSMETPPPIAGKQSRRSGGNTKARQRIRIIWTTEFALEFVKVLGICLMFSVFVNVMNNEDLIWQRGGGGGQKSIDFIKSIFIKPVRICLTMLSSIYLIVYLYHSSLRLDKAYLRS